MRVSLSKNTKRMSWRLPTRSPLFRLPPSNRRKARSRLAPPGASGTMIVSSETLPRRGGAPPSGALDGRRRRLGYLRFDLTQRVFQRLLPELRRVGEQRAQLLNLGL